MPLCIENSRGCLKPGCYLTRCAEQQTLYCFPHAMLFFARCGLPIANEPQATEVLGHAVKHFSLGYVVWGISPLGIQYVIPFWETAGLRRN